MHDAGSPREFPRASLCCVDYKIPFYTHVSLRDLPSYAFHSNICKFVISQSDLRINSLRRIRHIRFTIRKSSAVFAMRNMPRMYHDVLICGRSPHLSAGNEIYFITKVPTSRNILTNNTNVLILKMKYILIILTHRKYKRLSKGRLLSVNMPQSRRK